MKLSTCGGGQLRQRERNSVVLFKATSAISEKNT